MNVMLIWCTLVEASLPLNCGSIDYLRGRDASTSGRQMSMTVYANSNSFLVIRARRTGLATE
ncbi:MAG TPA: hypothetical protein VF690_02130, partial [Hymenobacter sp.]